MSQDLYIPENIHEHVDSVYLNFDVESEEGILAFVYINGNDTIVVWTNNEALALCNDPFTDFSDLLLLSF